MDVTLNVGHSLTIRHRGQLCAVYHFGQETPKPFFHPVLLGTGDDAALTLLSPHDHPHHRGLWFCWKFLNGENFWEESATPHRAVTRRLEVEQSTADGVRSTAELDWQLHTGEILLREERRLAVLPPVEDAERHRYAIDFDLLFTPAAGPVTLALVPVREQPWGGYAGLGYRPARGIDVRPQLLTSNGPATSADKGTPARWADYSGFLDGSGRAAGLALFDHPENPRHPPPFFVLTPPGFGFLNPSPLFHEPLTLAQQARLRLRYRALVHAGPGQPEDLEREFQRWVAQGKEQDHDA